MIQVRILIAFLIVVVLHCFLTETGAYAAASLSTPAGDLASNDAAGSCDWPDEPTTSSDNQGGAPTKDASVPFASAAALAEASPQTTVDTGSCDLIGDSGAAAVGSGDAGPSSVGEPSAGDDLAVHVHGSGEASVPAVADPSAIGDVLVKPVGLAPANDNVGGSEGRAPASASGSGSSLEAVAASGTESTSTIDAGSNLLTDAAEGAAAGNMEQQANSPPSPTPASLPPADAAAAAPAADAATPATPLVEPSTQPVPSAAEPANGLDELRSLLQQARQAVTLLEAAVARQELRLAGLAAAAATGAPTPGTASDPAMALLHTLGLDASSTSTAARKALRDALQLVMRERDARLGAGVGAAPLEGNNMPGAGIRSAAAPSTNGVNAIPGVGSDGDWFDQHFALRSSLRLAAPPPPAEPAAVPAAATGAPVTVTCAFPYELPHPNTAAAGGGQLLYVVAGDAAGMLYVLSPAGGSVLAAVHTGTDSAVTACSAFFVRKYESTVVTGHANGQTRSFAVVLQDAPQPPQPGAEQQQQPQQQPQQAAPPHKHRNRHRHSGGALLENAVVQSVTLRHVVESMPPGALPWAAVEELIVPGEAAAAAAAAVAAAGGEDGAAAAARPLAPAPPEVDAFVDLQYTGPPAPIMHILPYRLGHKVGGRRHIVVLDRAGNLRLDRENGTVRFWVRTNRTQLAVHFVGTHVVMLAAVQATILNTLQPRQPRSFGCLHLNGSRLLAAAFDGHRVFRGYGVNARGELLSMVTPHEGGLTSCKAHRATPLPWLDPGVLAISHHSLSLTPMRGYLLLTHGSGRVVFNVTGIVRNGIPSLTATTDDHIAVVAGASTVIPSPPADSTAAAGAAAAWAAAGGLINGLMPPPPVVAVGPGSQVVVMVLPPGYSKDLAAPPGDGTSEGGGAAADVGATGEAAAAGWPTPAAGAGGGAGLLVVMDSRMPRPLASGSASKVWSQPIFIGAMLLVGLYQFWRMSSNRSQRRTVAGGGRLSRGRRGHGGYGGGYDDAAEYMYGDNRRPGAPHAPPQPRSALRRGRSDRPTGRTVSYEDDEY